MRRLSYFHSDFFSFAEAQWGKTILKHTSGFQSDLAEDQKTVRSQVQDLEMRDRRNQSTNRKHRQLPTGSSLSRHIGCFPDGTLKRVKTAHNKMAC